MTRSAIALGLAAALAAWGYELSGRAPAPIVALAVLPVVGWALLFAWPARRAGVGMAALLAAFLWGALGAAPLSAHVNEACRDAIGTSLDLGGRWNAVATVVGPVVEELAKALPLLALPFLRRRGARTVPWGLALGAASGLGFAATENVVYLTIAAFQGGMPGLMQATWARGVLSGFKHALFTATLGAGLGLAAIETTSARAWAAATAGLVGALVQHAAWNGLASPLVQDALCDRPAPGEACAASAGSGSLFLWTPAIVALALLPGLAAIAWFLRDHCDRSDRAVA
ncbi:MAG: PrsW family intramembrane metalloprotease [Alphaproteobacteria bacterium]